MKNKVIIIGVMFLIAIISFVVGKNIDNWKNSHNQKEVEERYIRSTILVTNKQDSTETSGTMSRKENMSETELNEIKNVFISDNVKGKVKQLYPKVGNVEITAVKDTKIVEVLYVCDEYSDEECIDILNKYIEYFSEVIKNNGYENVYVVDRAELPPQTRIVEK